MLHSASSQAQELSGLIEVPSALQDIINLFLTLLRLLGNNRN